jgi:hypothetical protein
VLETGDRPRADARTRLEAFRRDSRQGGAAHLIALRLPSLAGDPQHGALARTGVAHHKRQVLAPCDPLQGAALLVAKAKPPPLAGADRTLHRRRPHAMSPPIGEALGRPLKALFGRQHVAGAEPLAAGAVLAERDQLGRGFDRAHGLGELVRIVRVTVNETRQIVVGEGALLASDGVQRHAWFGDDLLAVSPGDVPVIDGPLGVLATVQAPRAGRADLMLRLQLDALRLKRPVIHLGVDPQLRQPLVHMAGPALAPVAQKLGAIPVADLLAEAFGTRFAHRQHDVGVRLGQAVRPHVPMHIEVRDHPSIDELGLHKIPRQLHALRLVHLSWYRELDLSGELGVLALLAKLDLVPQGLAVLPALGRTLRGHDLRMHHAALVGEVVATSKPLVLQARRRTIGRRRDGAGPVGAADHLGAEVVDGHGGQPALAERQFQAYVGTTYKRALKVFRLFVMDCRDGL